MRVALFPYDEDLTHDRDFVDELMLVASALQAQVTSDVGPVWGVSAVVAAFRSLELVPEGYVPFGVTSKPLPLNRAGFHFTEGGQPAALIQYCGDWSTSASHELIEMLCDPTGTKTVVAQSLDQSQELVAYMMEVCDPVEESKYRIGTVNVSDFITPAFYGTIESPFRRFSFSGRVREPLQLLGGGYITWTTQWPDAHVYQAFANEDDPVPVDSAKLERKDLGPTPLVLSRAWVDAASGGDPERHRREDTKCTTPERYVRRSEDEARSVRFQMDNAWGTPPTPVDRDKLQALFRRLATDDTFRENVKADPVRALEDVGFKGPFPGLPERGQRLLTRLPDKSDYQKLLHSAEQGHPVGYNFVAPSVFPWTFTLPHG
jgi:putative modified peptide